MLIFTLVVIFTSAMQIISISLSHHVQSDLNEIRSTIPILRIDKIFFCISFYQFHLASMQRKA